MKYLLPHETRFYDGTIHVYVNITDLFAVDEYKYEIKTCEINTF